MAAFELNNMYNPKEPRGTAKPTHHQEDDNTDSKKLREECIIALKVYDSCRQQDCVKIRPARAATGGAIVKPPAGAESVVIEDIEIVDIVIVSKKPSICNNGTWDVTIRYIFEYDLVFLDVEGNEISVGGRVRVRSSFTKTVTLFGSITCGDSVIYSDLDSLPLTDMSEPFVLVEAKVIELSAEIHYEADDGVLEATDVEVFIGLFTIIKLFRIVNLLVESGGFCIPEECPDVDPIRSCEFFEGMDFPVDVFAPPQKPEFFAGISGNIPSKKGRGVGCGREL